MHTWTLHVADDAAGCVVHEFDADLSNTTTGACKYSTLTEVSKEQETPQSVVHFLAVMTPVLNEQRQSNPEIIRADQNFPLNRTCTKSKGRKRTGASEDTGNLDELDWLLVGIHLCVVGKGVANFGRRGRSRKAG